MVDVPNTFVPGEVASATEVNENFNALRDGINSVSSEISSINTSIINLEDNKANKEGNQSVQFKVAKATTDYDAVNKKMLESYVGNLIYYIYGLEIKKNEQQGNDWIKVTSGQCYDSNGDYRILLENDTAYQNDIQAANKEYSVFITGEKTESGDTTNVDVSFVEGSSASSPTGLSSEMVYRKLGTYTTDNNNNISVINSLSNTASAEYGSFTVLNQTLSGNQTTNLASVLPSDGRQYLIWVYCHASGIGSGASCYVNTDIFPSTLVVRCDSDASRNSHSQCCVTIPVGTGRSVTVTRTSTLIGYMRV